MFKLQRNFEFPICVFLVVVLISGHVQGLASRRLKGGFLVVRNSEEDKGSVANPDSHNNKPLDSNIQKKVNGPTYVAKSEANKGGSRRERNHGQFYSYRGKYNEGPNVHVNPKNTSGNIARNITAIVKPVIHHTEDYERYQGQTGPDLTSEKWKSLEESVAKQQREMDEFFNGKGRFAQMRAAFPVDSGEDKAMYTFNPVDVSNDILSRPGKPEEEISEKLEFHPFEMHIII